MTLFPDSDRKRISKAIAEAESATSGEIVTVVTSRSDDYFFLPFLLAALSALFVPLPLLYFSDWPALHVYIIQLLVFVAGGTLALWPPTRIALVPGVVKRARAHRNAVEQFLAQNLHTTGGRTGVLIFVSVAEHFAEVIADKGIYDKVPPDTWESIVDSLTERIARGEAAEGFLLAIGECGAVLAEHFPPGSADENELPDHLIVLD